MLRSICVKWIVANSVLGWILMQIPALWHRALIGEERMMGVNSKQKAILKQRIIQSALGVKTPVSVWGSSLGTQDAAKRQSSGQSPSCSLMAPCRRCEKALYRVCPILLYIVISERVNESERDEEKAFSSCWTCISTEHVSFSIFCFNE